MKYSIISMEESRRTNKDGSRRFNQVTDTYDILPDFIEGLMSIYEAPRVNGYKYVGEIVTNTGNEISVKINTVPSEHTRKKSDTF